MTPRLATSPLVHVVLALTWCAVGCGGSEAGDANKLIKTGWDFFRASDFTLAASHFEGAVAVSAPRSEQHQQALYGLATTLALRRPDPDRARAEALFRQLIDEAPTSDLAGWSELAVARLRQLAPVGEAVDLNAVRAAFQQVIDRHPNHPAADEALFHQQMTLLTTRRPDDARAVAATLQRYIDTHPDSKWRGFAYSLIGCCFEVTGEADKRLTAELKAFENREIDTSNPRDDTSWTYWGIATIAEFGVGDFDTARTYYRKLIEEYPTDFHVFPAKQALVRMDELEAKLKSGMNNARAAR